MKNNTVVKNTYLAVDFGGGGERPVMAGSLFQFPLEEGTGHDTAAPPSKVHCQISVLDNGVIFHGIGFLNLFGLFAQYIHFQVATPSHRHRPTE